MQAPMSKKFRKLTSNPQEAQKLTEKILTSKGNEFEFIINGKKIKLKQIGI